MQNISDKIKELIPPSDYQQRNGFSNEHLIDKLSKDQKTAVEAELLQMFELSDDSLIGETLTYLNSSKAIPLIESKLNISQDSTSKIHWASMINTLKKGDQKMKDIAFHEFSKLSDKYQLIGAFHTLTSFNDQRINKRISSYANDPEYLIAYNARTAIGQSVEELIKNEQQESRPWWKFW